MLPCLRPIARRLLEVVLDGLLGRTGARLRHVKGHSPEATEDPALPALIEAALTEGRAALGS